jgi:hypothetical protein
LLDDHRDQPEAPRFAHAHQLFPISSSKSTGFSVTFATPSAHSTMLSSATPASISRSRSGSA